MKYKFPIIAGICLAIIIVALFQVTYYFDPSLDKYSQTITVIYQPSEIDKIRHEPPYEPTKLTPEDFKDHPQVQQLLDLAMTPKESVINDKSKIDTIFYEYGSDLYRISQPGPYTIRADFFMTSFNQYEYINWIETNLIGVSIYESHEMHFIKYKDEVFILTFEDVQEID